MMRDGFQCIGRADEGGAMKLLDLFCGAGGAAMGYHRAGFDIERAGRSVAQRLPALWLLVRTRRAPASILRVQRTSPPASV